MAARHQQGVVLGLGVYPFSVVLVVHELPDWTLTDTL